MVPGDLVYLAEMFDLSCFPYVMKGERKPRVGCAVLDATSRFEVDSYGASVSELDVDIVKFDANRVGKILFYRKQPCLPKTTNYAAFVGRMRISINKLRKLGVTSKSKLKQAVNLLQVDDYAGAGGVLRTIQVSRLNPPQQKKTVLKKQIAKLQGLLTPKC